MSTLQRIRRKILGRDYYISWHVEEEMMEDNLERADVAHAILKGRITHKLTHDLRGTRYIIEGPAKDGRSAHVICRFKESGELLIITAYVP